MASRRDFIRQTVSAAGSLILSSQNVLRGAPFDGGSLIPTTIPKYQGPLVIPPAMPRSGVTAEGIDYTKLASGSSNSSFCRVHFCRRSRPPSGLWFPEIPLCPRDQSQSADPGEVVNQLVDKDRNYLPHLFAVDPTLHWANPAGPIDTRRMDFTSTPTRYTGPVPLVTHLHGGHTPFDSDG
jgi:spore coat protein A, manganese oxidase